MAATQADWRTANTMASQMAEAARTEADNAKAEAANAKAVANSSKVMFVVDVVVMHTATLAITAGSKVKPVDVPDARVGDRIYVHRNGEPVAGGINVGGSITLEATGYVPTNGTVNIYHSIPAVSLGQSLTIPLRLVGLRPAVV